MPAQGSSMGAQSGQGGRKTSFIASGRGVFHAGLFSSTECRSLGQCDKPTVSYRYLYLVLFGASHGPDTLLYVLKTLYHLIFIPALRGRCCYHPFSKMRNHSAGHLPSRAQLGNCKRGCG